jgi:poly(A) polymerase
MPRVRLLIPAKDAWLVADFPLEPAVLASIADQAVARLARDLKLETKNKN